MRVQAYAVDKRPTIEAVIAAVARPGVAVLDSADLGPARGRYTIVAFDPVEVRSWAAGSEDPLEAMRRLLKRTVRPCAFTRENPGQFVGWIGYLAYEAGRYIERLPSTTQPDIRLPLARFALYDTAAVHDGATGQWLIVTANSQRVAEWRAILAQAGPVEVTAPPRPGQPLSNMTREHYLRQVARAREYIAAGDIFQVNFARRETFEQREPPWRTYLRLRRVNPAAYGAFLAWETPPPRPRAVAAGLRAGGSPQRPPKPGGPDTPPEPAVTAILSASPELFLQLRGRDVVSRPIKGTRPRSGDPVIDAALRAELAASPKDRAELAMIVDLVRNDLGRVCEYGSVRVVSPCNSPACPYELETHPTVHHLVATVAGWLREDRDAIDLVRACFPGGSITGAPKVRAMQIIDELEPTQRSVYTGSIGLFGLDGSMTLNLAIRTLIATGGRIHLHVGGGIVADSIPQDEYEETQAKARGMRQALGAELNRAGPKTWRTEYERWRV